MNLDILVTSSMPDTKPKSGDVCVPARLADINQSPCLSPKASVSQSGNTALICVFNIVLVRRAREHSDRASLGGAERESMVREGERAWCVCERKRERAW